MLGDSQYEDQLAAGRSPHQHRNNPELDTPRPRVLQFADLLPGKIDKAFCCMNFAIIHRPNFVPRQLIYHSQLTPYSKFLSYI